MFLAGGITGCEDWQRDAAQALAIERCVVCNPRRKTFDVADPDAAAVQVAWEYHHLRLPRVLMMFWFPACDPAVTAQPIALFELGSALERRSLDRLVVVGADPGYPRRLDIVEQLRNAAADLEVHDSLEATLASARTILNPEDAFWTGDW